MFLALAHKGLVYIHIYIYIYIYIVCILVICIFIDIVDIALCVCRLLLYNNFKRGVMSRVNVCLAFRVLLYFLYLIASCYRAIIGIV